ncbi:MAG: LPP20 family lipoprotein [Bacteroidales bacterium]
MNRVLLLLMLITMLTGCFTGRKSSHERMMRGAPDWVLQTPNHPSYYHGVGMVPKNEQFDYRERARQVALNELAGSISVNISSSSALNYFEFDHLSSEFFRDNIRMTTQEYLEGYELIGNWENEQQYWVYYRLSKARYQQIKQERISRALNISQSKFDQARLFAGQGRMADALGFYVRAFEDIRDFIGEDLTTRIDGQEKPYATVLMSDLAEQMQHLSVVFPIEKVLIKPGSLLAPVEPVVVNINSDPISGIPIITSFSWLPGRRVEAVTDAAGRYRVMPDGLKPGMQNQQVVSAIDLDKIVRQNSSDIVVQKFFEVVRLSTFTLPIEVVPPVFYISAGNTLAPARGSFAADAAFDAEIRRLLRQEGFVITDEQAHADYSMIIQTNVSAPVQHGNRYSSSVIASIDLLDSQGNSIRSMQIDDVAGIGIGSAQAVEDAFNSLKSKFRITVYPELIKPLF